MELIVQAIIGLCAVVFGLMTMRASRRRQQMSTVVDRPDEGGLLSNVGLFSAVGSLLLLVVASRTDGSAVIYAIAVGLAVIAVSVRFRMNRKG